MKKSETPKSKSTTQKKEGSEPSAQMPEALDPYALRVRDTDVLLPLSVNPGKVNDMQPVLLGKATIDELFVDVSLWHQETKDKRRDYYSATVRDAEKAKQAWVKSKEQIEPLARLKIYQFQGLNPGEDPDYATSEPWIYNGKARWALLWIDVPKNFPENEDDITEDDLRKIEYCLILSSRRPREKWQKGLQEDLRSAQSHLILMRRDLASKRLMQARRLKNEADYEAEEMP
jgi:hypothetical protein